MHSDIKHAHPKTDVDQDGKLVCMQADTVSIPVAFIDGKWQMFMLLDQIVMGTLFKGALSPRGGYYFSLNHLPLTCWHTPVNIWQVGQTMLYVNNISVLALLVVNFWSKHYSMKNNIYKKIVSENVHILCPLAFKLSHSKLIL